MGLWLSIFEDNLNNLECHELFTDTLIRKTLIALTFHYPKNLSLELSLHYWANYWLDCFGSWTVVEARGDAGDT